MAPCIAIIGAGPGGCILARLLYNNHIPCTIFEGEVSIDYRAQGGTLDLRARTGMAAIKEAGLWKEFQKYARYDGESLLATRSSQHGYDEALASQNSNGKCTRHRRSIEVT
jgi:2-polyprenyl-6-methoxyphenol hydroxylase-like FAD-dependent oxidoreductase